MPSNRSRGPRPPSLGFAAPPPAPKTGDGGTFDAELAQWIRQRRKVDMVRQLEVGAVPGGAGVPVSPGIPQVMPQPASLTEAMHVATGLSTLGTNAAKTAMDVADLERQRRIDAEQDAGDAAAAARADEAAKWDAITKMGDRFNERIEKLTEAQHTAELAAKDSEAARIAASMKADADRMVAAVTQEKERVERELASAKATVAQLAQRPTYEGIVAKALTNPDDPELETLRRVLVPDANRPLTPQEKWAHGYVEERLQSEREGRLMKRARHIRAMSLMRHLDGLATEGRGALRGLLPGGPRGLARNGVDPTFGDEGQDAPEGGEPQGA